MAKFLQAIEILEADSCVMVVYIGDTEQCRVPVKFENGSMTALESFSISEPTLARYEIENKAGEVLVYTRENPLMAEFKLTTV